ncbi:MAG: C69 family dipeptidase [Clostridia bacterium]|nr:C69 family dipeptidase [Clostridia bacterium]
MACTTVLVGRKATHDNSTMIARTDDGSFNVKYTTYVPAEKQPKRYRSVLSHAVVDLPETPMGYTKCSNVVLTEGEWPATGINEANVGMTATETITTNPRVLAADPMVRLRKAKSRREKEIPGGIGEEDFVILVLPYIRTAREGVLRLGKLLEKYGTYESNGIAFNDENECWWMETIGGHHWIARRVPDEVVVLAPNQFALDHFDLDDALGEGKEFLCSADLRSFIEDNRLDCNADGTFNPRNVFGSHTDMDHIYNTPRAWFMGRYLTPNTFKWDGPDADFGPESDDLPWCVEPERLVSIEDVEYLLSAHYQGTDYDPYRNTDTGKRGMYRSIGINRTGVTSICQIRSGVPDALKGVEWICYGSTTFAPFVPLYPAAKRVPAYLSDVKAEVSSENLYWASRLIAALADPHFADCRQSVDRYLYGVTVEARRIMHEAEAKYEKIGDISVLIRANEDICKAAKEKTNAALGTILHTASVKMKNGYKLSDN